MNPQPATVHQIAAHILDQEPDPVVRFRLLRDVLDEPQDSQAFVQARANLAASRWVQELGRGQWPDGSWGGTVPYYHDRLLCTLAAVIAPHQRREYQRSRSKQMINVSK